MYMLTARAVRSPGVCIVFLHKDSQTLVIKIYDKIPIGPLVGVAISRVT